MTASETGEAAALLRAAYDDARTAEMGVGPICYVRRGRGKPIVLLHGVPLSLLTWRHNIDALARDAEVIAIDMKGFGRSHKPPGAYSPEAHAEVVAALLEDIGVEGYDIVGSSYGCAVAVAVAVARPDAVRRLVLINSVGFPGGPHALTRMARMTIVGALLARVLRAQAIGRRVLASSLRRSYADPSLATPALVDAYASLIQEGDGLRSFFATLRALDEKVLAARLPQVRQPTLLLWGGQDRVLPAAHATLHLRAISGSVLHLLPECGHLPHEERPGEVNRRIAEFFLN